MLAPIPVRLVPHDPGWAKLAHDEAERIRSTLGSSVIAVHHIGSTAVPGIRAKPIIDLLPVVKTLRELDAMRVILEEAGFQWWGQLGLPGRRYCTKSQADTGVRLVQAHCYEQGSPEITRHLAFRDYLRAHPPVAMEYEAEKLRCAQLHPGDSHAYAECKSAWIIRTEADALVWNAEVRKNPARLPK